MGTLNKFAVSLAASALIFSQSNASWLSDFLQSADVSVSKESAGYYKTQASGFATGGSIRVRWQPITNLTFFNWTPPSINVGCNGIDATWGSFSYMNLDQLVEKLSKLASAAPAFATQLAISTLCKDCQAILDELESIAGLINGINFDACEIAMNFAKQTGEALNSQIFGGKYDDATAGFKAGLTKAKEEIGNWASTLNANVRGLTHNYDSPSNKQMQQGSLMEKVYDKLKDNKTFAFKTIIKQYAEQTPFNEQIQLDFLRALYGDLNGYITEPNANGEGGVATQWQYIYPTINMEQFFKTFWLGDGSEKIKIPNYKPSECDMNKGCKVLQYKSDITLEKINALKEVYANTIKNIVKAIENDETIAGEQLTFINTQPIQIFDYLNLLGTGKINLDETITEMLSFMMFQISMEDLNAEILQTLGRVQADNADGAAKVSDQQAFNAAKEEFMAAQTNLRHFLNQESKKLNEKIQKQKSIGDMIEEEINKAIKQGLKGK